MILCQFLFIEVDLVEFRPSKRKENHFSELLFLSLTWKPQQEWLDLFRNPQWSSGCRQSTACLFFKLLLGLNTCRPVPAFPPALVWLHLTFCKIRTRFNSCSAERQLCERTPTDGVAEKRVTTV